MAYRQTNSTRVGVFYFFGLLVVMGRDAMHRRPDAIDDGRIHPHRPTIMTHNHSSASALVACLIVGVVVDSCIDSIIALLHCQDIIILDRVSIRKVKETERE